jgi:hypothetical protein
VEPDSPTANATPAEADGVPSLRGQLGATIDAVKRLLQAHVDLAKAELSEVVDEVKRMAALAGLALAALLMLGILVTLGGLLFLGEWLFGSIGWGVVLGGQLLLDVALIALFAALELRGRSIGLSFVVAALIGLGVGLVFGLDLSHRGWSAVGDAIAPTGPSSSPSPSSPGWVAWPVSSGACGAASVARSPA